MHVGVHVYGWMFVYGNLPFLIKNINFNLKMCAVTISCKNLMADFNVRRNMKLSCECEQIELLKLSQSNPIFCFVRNPGMLVSFMGIIMWRKHPQLSMHMSTAGTTNNCLHMVHPGKVTLADLYDLENIFIPIRCNKMLHIIFISFLFLCLFLSTFLLPPWRSRDTTLDQHLSSVQLGHCHISKAGKCFTEYK